MATSAIGGYALTAAKEYRYYIALVITFAVTTLVRVMAHSYNNLLTVYSVVQTQSGSV